MKISLFHFPKLFRIRAMLKPDAKTVANHLKLPHFPAPESFSKICLDYTLFNKKKKTAFLRFSVLFLFAD